MANLVSSVFTARVQVKHCPLKGCTAPEESRGRSQWIANKEHVTRKVATIGVTSGDHPVDKKTKKRQRIAELCRQLQEAKVEETMADVMAMMLLDLR